MKNAVKLLVVALLAVVSLVGCGGGPTSPDSGVKAFAFLGDSITHGRRSINDSAPSEPGFRVRLLDRLAAIGRPMEAIEAGEPGSLSKQGAVRVNDVLVYDPAIMNVLYGTNDALFGVSKEETVSNLEDMVLAGRRAGVVVVLNTLPPTCAHRGAQNEWIQSINPRIRELASKLNREKGEVYLADVAAAFESRGGCRLINSENGVHPTEEGYALIADTIFESIRNAKW